MKHIQLSPNTPEWHDWRSSVIGASDAPSIMGIGYMTPYELYLNKLGLYQTQVNPMMQRGHDLEPLARQAFIEEYGYEIKPAIVQSTQHPFMGASLDGVDKDESIIVEIKTGGGKTLEMAKNGIVPDHHYCQIQHQLAVTGLDKCIYYFFDGKFGYATPVMRYTKYIENLIEQERKFWNCVLNFSPPALSDRDYVEQSGEWLDLTQELLPLLDTMKKAEAREKEIRERLIHIASDRNSCGGGIKLTRIPRQGSIDYSQIDALKDVDLTKYRKQPMITWRVSRA